MRGLAGNQKERNGANNRYASKGRSLAFGNRRWFTAGRNQARDDVKSVIPLATIFAGAGAIIGFLLRPSDNFGQQLPLSMVLTRGSGLHGLNRLLIPLAERSFNEMVAGLIVGAVLGTVVGALLDRR